MAIPISVTQLLVTLVLVVPGFVSQAVRIRVAGRRPGDRHAVLVLLAEVSETDGDLNAFQRVTFELGVDREQLRLGIPA